MLCKLINYTNSKELYLQFGIHKIIYITLLLHVFKILQVICLYITGHIDSIFSEEYRKEILRYIYYHQVYLLNNFNIYTKLIMI